MPDLRSEDEQLIEAIRKGDVEQIRELIENGADEALLTTANSNEKIDEDKTARLLAALSLSDQP